MCALQSTQVKVFCDGCGNEVDPLTKQTVAQIGKFAGTFGHWCQDCLNPPKSKASKKAAKADAGAEAGADAGPATGSKAKVDPADPLNLGKKAKEPPK